jgi:hypothetical protein
VGRCGLVSSGSGCGPVVGCCEHGNEHSDSKKMGNFVTEEGLCFMQLFCFQRKHFGDGNTWRSNVNRNCVCLLGLPLKLDPMKLLH